MPATTAAAFAGIHNENEFYSHHYLSEIFSGDIRATVDGWRDAAEARGGRTPYAALRCQRPSKPDGFLDTCRGARLRHRFSWILMKGRTTTAVGAVGNRVLRGFPSSLRARSLRPWGAAASTAPALAAGTAFG